jgi:hypothetical protein
MSGIFYLNIALMLVSIAVIPIMASLNAPSLSTKIGSIRPRPNSPRMEAVVEAEVDAVAEVALLVKAMVMVVIEPTPAGRGRTTNGGIGKHDHVSLNGPLTLRIMSQYFTYIFKPCM